MQVICKRTILFYDEKQRAEGKVPVRSHTVHHSKDVQDVPDWIRDQVAFKNAAKDDTIREVKLQVVEVEDDPPLDITKLNKTELIAHAKEVHGLTLDAGMKRDDMVKAIEDVVKAKE